MCVAPLAWLVQRSNIAHNGRHMSSCFGCAADMQGQLLMCDVTNSAITLDELYLKH